MSEPEYVVVALWDLECFIEEVNYLIRVGYKLQGGMSVAVDSYGERFYAQALVTGEEEK